MNRFASKVMFVAGLSFATATVFAQGDLTAEQKAKVDAKIKEVTVWGTDSLVVADVKAANTTPPALNKEMTQEKWKALTAVSPEVRGLLKSPVGLWCKAHKTEVVSELFVSAADGTKVGFTSKTSNWSHKGKPKHDVPMTGKTWIGESEQDASTGKAQVQVSFPVLDGTKAIGSIVIGLDLSKL